MNPIEIFVIIVILLTTFFISYKSYYYFMDNDSSEVEETESSESSESTNYVYNDNKEVYNVYENVFKYDDAEKVCEILGGELASYEQILNAYNDGAEWCNYGWSKDQSAYYPMINKIDKCGDVGINGGVFDPELEFGVNCYGVKPDEIKYVEPDTSIDNDNLIDLLNNGKTIINYYNESENKWSKYS